MEFGRVDPEAVGEGFPKRSGMRSFYRHGWEQFQSAGQASLDPGGGEDGGEGVKIEAEMESGDGQR